jgi:hypothetical protein
MSNKGQKKTREKLMQKADSFLREMGMTGPEYERFTEPWWVIFHSVCVEAGICPSAG